MRRFALSLLFLAAFPAHAYDYALDWVSVYSPMTGAATYTVNGYTLYEASYKAVLTRVALNVLNTGIAADGQHVGLRLNTTSDTSATKNVATSLEQNLTLFMTNPGGAVCSVLSQNVTSYGTAVITTDHYGCSSNSYANRLTMTGTGTITVGGGTGNCPLSGTYNMSVTWAFQGDCSATGEWLCTRECTDPVCGVWTETGSWNFGTNSCQTPNNCQPTCR